MPLTPAQFHKNGFTLVEVLIAIAIFAILSVLAYGGLNSVIKNKTQAEQSLERLEQVQLTMTKLHRDIEQIAARNATDELGGKQLKLSAGQGDDLLIQFTRTGWKNPVKTNRSHLQRVAYKLDEDKLIRIYWPYVDRAQDDQAVELDLLDNLKDVRFKFLDDSKEWHDSWPTRDASSSDEAFPQPNAIEVTLEMEDWGEVVRVFRVPRGS